MLEIKRLTKIYPGPVAALEGVTLTIEKGMFGLLGPNGAGKTTLMRILAGTLEPTSGEVLLDSEDVVSEPRKIWRQLGYLPQYFGFYPHLTGAEMLTHLLRLKGVQEDGKRGMKHTVEGLLERVNLTAAAGQKVRGYSGGMRQRLGIAQAIAGNPRLIIVDEPTAGLDPEERLRFYRLLAELAEERIVLLSTHIVEDVAVLCPRFAVLRKGRVVTQTTPMDSRQALEGAIFEGEVPSSALGEIHAHHHVTQALLVEGRNRVRIYEPERHAPLPFESSPPTLEDAYMVMMHQGGLQ